MLQVKVILGTAAIISILAALALIWFDTEFVFGVTASKVFASLFILLGVVLTRDCCLMSSDYEQEVRN